jgi:ABC-2 type transport system ATP-binding protein
VFYISAADQTRRPGETLVTDAAVFDSVEKLYKVGPLGRARVPAVRNVSLTVPVGSVFGLLGPNRAGKTTLVKLLLSLARPTGGSVGRLGEPASARHTLARVGYMHENHAFPRYLSAAEVLHFYGGLSGVPSEELPARATRLLERVGLADRAREPITRFSKGMVQRLGLAQALVNDPDLLILDEPTEGLDLTGRQLLREVVREFKRSGKTVLLVTHVLSEVEELCDELAVLVAGRVAYRGNLDQLIGPPGNRRPLEPALRGLYEKGAAE